MSIFSIFKSNNPKKDPYWDFEPESHFRPNLNKGDFFRLTGFDFGWFVLEPISIFVNDKEHEVERSKSLSFGQKALYYWWYVDAQVTNGGFLQFYYNGYGHYVPTVLKSLEYIGDIKMVELIQKADDVYKANKKSIDKAKENDLFGEESYEELDKFSDLNKLYYKLHEKTMTNIEKYVRKNPMEFCLDENGNEFDLKFSGDCKTYYPNGQTKESFKIEKGKVSGEFSVFYENGKIKEKIQFIKGRQTGEKEEFDVNGIIVYTVTKDLLLNQFRHQCFYTNGNPKELEHRQINKDERIGEYKEWYENGQLSETGTYVSSSEREGPWLEFYPDGSKKMEAEFKNGDFILQNFWKENSEQTLINGTGLYIFYYYGFTDFVTRYEQEYKDYKRHGTQKTFNDEVLTLYQEMENGVENGYTRSYYKNGKIQEETLYRNGVIVSDKLFPRIENPVGKISFEFIANDDWFTNEDLAIPDILPICINEEEIKKMIIFPKDILKPKYHYLDGHMSLWLTLNENGDVSDVRFSSSYMAKGCNLEDVAENFKFIPAIKDGENVPSILNVEAEFTIE